MSHNHKDLYNSRTVLLVSHPPRYKYIKTMKTNKNLVEIFAVLSAITDKILVLKISATTFLQNVCIIYSNKPFWIFFDVTLKAAAHFKCSFYTLSKFKDKLIIIYKSLGFKNQLPDCLLLEQVQTHRNIL